MYLNENIKVLFNAAYRAGKIFVVWKILWQIRHKGMNKIAYP
jgi:hypothetical protein